MCSILGLYKHGGDYLDHEKHTIGMLYRKVSEKSISRGRDSGGISVLDRSGVRSVKHTDPYRLLNYPVVSTDTTIVIQNCRAEPTNEYVEKKTTDDIQPFEYKGVHAVHNGTISNDKEILPVDKSFPTSVDSYSLAYALKKNIFEQLEGSIACAYFREGSDILTLYKNYKPISVFYLGAYKTYFFVSLDEFFTGPADEMLLEYRKLEFPPYSTMTIGKGGHHVFVEERVNNKAVVICSGGLDSTTVAKVACMENEDILLAYFDYGCRAQDREREAVKKITTALQQGHLDKRIECKFFDMSFVKDLGGNPLTDYSMKVAEGEAGAEFAHEWVPARNTVMIALVAAYCDRWDIGNIYLGLNLEESSAYPDNTVMFYRHFNEVLDVGTKARPVIKNPLDNLMKHEIVKLALEIQAPIEHSWSCYHGGDIHCGNCGPCYLRSKAFKMNGVKDMLGYEKLPYGWWNGCVSIEDWRKNND